MSLDLTSNVKAKIESLNVSRESIARLEVLVRTLEAWQSKINLVAPSTIGAIWERHVLDSLQLLKFLPTQNNQITDLGSGGGFPGLVLAACQPATVHFYEANGKKVAFLREALRQMSVKGEVHQVRLGEKLFANQGSPARVVTARAFAPLDELLTYAQPFFGSETIGLFHKGQDVDAELKEAAKSWDIKYSKHISLTDSNSVILEVKEFSRV